MMTNDGRPPRNAGGAAIRPRHPNELPVYERVYLIVQEIPRGKVMTYGQIAEMVEGCTARMTGYAMAALKGRDDVPWQRVVNRLGEISTRTKGEGEWLQQELLKEEGVIFDKKNRIDLKKYRWTP